MTTKNINLQLFAVSVTTDAGLSAEMKTFYDMKLIDEASPNLVHMQFGQKRPIPKGSGKTIEFRKFDRLPKALTPLTEGVTPAGSNLTVSAITATVSQYGDFISQSDVLELTALDNTIVEATKILGNQAGATLDTVVRNVLVAGTNVSYAPTVANNVETEVQSRSGMNATSKLTVSLVQRIIAKLKAQNTPKINGCYIAIVHPYATYDLQRDPEWIRAAEYKGVDELFVGEIGKLGCVRFVESTEAKIWRDATCPQIVPDTASSTTPDDAAFSNRYAVFGCLFFGEGAYGTTEVTGGGLETIIKQKGSAGTADPLDQRSSIGWKALLTAERLVEPYMVRVECISEFSETAFAN